MLPLESTATPTGVIAAFVAGVIGVVDGVDPPPPAISVIVADVLAEAGEAEMASVDDTSTAAHTATPRLRLAIEVPRAGSSGLRQVLDLGNIRPPPPPECPEGTQHPLNLGALVLILKRVSDIRRHIATTC
jgi:hypothetical protein